jgi:hypothetical protein
METEVDLCRSVADDLETLVPDIVERIRTEISAYGPVPRDEHEYHVREQFRGLLAGLADRRTPTPEQTEAARELGRQRAFEGVPVEAVIGAYHVGYQEIWNVLLTRAESRGGGLTQQLVRLVNLAWTWVWLVSSASADAHAEATRSRQAVQIGLVHRLLDVLRRGEATSDEAVFLARALGFDPEGDFQAVCSPAAEWPEEGLDRLRRRLSAQPGTVHGATQGAFTVILVQGADAAGVADSVRALSPAPLVGIGLRRPGLDGAELSVGDAELALKVAPSADGLSSFAEHWLAACLSPQRRRIAPLLERGGNVAAAHPHLAEAVRAFAGHGYSVTAGARALHLHPNTVKYRLDRWRELTGWDPWAPDGLTKSLLSIRLFDRAEQPHE